MSFTKLSTMLCNIPPQQNHTVGEIMRCPHYNIADLMSRCLDTAVKPIQLPVLWSDLHCLQYMLFSGALSIQCVVVAHSLSIQHLLSHNSPVRL